MTCSNMGSQPRPFSGVGVGKEEVAAELLTKLLGQRQLEGGGSLVYVGYRQGGRGSVLRTDVW